jgi:hypothetical protein
MWSRWITEHPKICSKFLANQVFPLPLFPTMIILMYMVLTFEFTGHCAALSRSVLWNDGLDRDIAKYAQYSITVA